MALLTLNGLYNDSDCYWIISGLQSPFNSEYYLKAGLSAVPVEAGSAWEDIEADILIYEAAGSGTDNYAEGIYVNSDPITLYGFTQAANGLCYPAGGPEEWPGIWTYYHLSPETSLTSKSIGVELTDLDPAYNHTRVFVCYLDDVKKTEQDITALAETWEYIIAPVYFASPHKVKVQVYSYGKVVLFYEREYTANTIYPDITPWSWNLSNGMATDAQTQAAYTALINKGQTADFAYKVWDDFVNKIAEAREETGQSWLTSFGSKANTLIGVLYGSLTAARYNAAVDNICYPYWNWAQKPGSEGYLGRLLVRGVSTHGANADTVYAAYLLELARKLNIMISIYNNTADISDANILLDTVLDISAAAYSGPSAPITAFQESLLDYYAYLTSSPKLLIQASENIQLSHSFSLYKALTAPIEHALCSMEHGILSAAAYLPTLHIRAYCPIYTALSAIASKIQIVPAEASLSSLHSHIGAGTVVQALPVFSSVVIAEHFYAGTIGLALPQLISAEAYSSQDSSVNIHITESLIQALVSSEMSTDSIAVLEIESATPPPEWEFPVQIYVELYITQTYSAAQADNVLNLE